MENFKWESIKKSWFTTIIGVLMVGASVYKFIQTGDIDFQELVIALTGIGLIGSKDAWETHEKQ